MTRYFLAFLLATWSGLAVADPITPDGEIYTAPGRLAGYSWNAGVSLSNLDEMTIPYGNKSEWAVTDPVACLTACEAFLSCKAFLFIEPKLKQKKPRCRMLSEASDFEVRRGYNLYLPKD